MLTDLTIVEARVDWLTVSAPLGPEFDVLAGIAARGLVDEQRRGEKLISFRPHGWDAARAGSWTWAQNSAGGYVSVGGHDAEAWCRPLLMVAHKCSRIDYAITAQASSALINPVPAAMRDLRERYQDDPMADSIQRYAGLKRDHALSIGKRGAPYYGRVYNKSLESRGRYPPCTWRWEIELRRHASEFERAEYQLDPKRVDMAGYLVARHMARWGIETPHSAGPTIRMAKQVRRVSDAERALEWLRRQVRPTIQWLFEIGYRDEVNRVLFSDLGITTEVA